MNGWRIALVLSLGLSFLCARQAEADGLVRDGVGAISTGRGGTNIAFADNGAIILDNPAGMANIKGCSLFEVGLDTVITDLDYTDLDPNDADGEFRAFPSPHVGYVHRSEDGCWAYGIGVFSSAGFGAHYNMQNPVFGPSTYKSIGVLAKVLPGAAVQLTDRLSVGATLGLAFSHVELEGPYFLQTALPGLPTLLDLKADGTDITGSIGLQYQLTPCTTVGVVYQEQSRVNVDGKVNATAFVPPPLGPLSVGSWFDAEFDITWPRSVGVGVLHHLCGCRRVSAEVIWYNWSDAFDRLDLTLTNPSNPLITAMLGPQIRESFPLNWEDTISVRLGYEKDLTLCDTVRFGYVYHESPVPDSTLVPYIDGVLEHAFSIGYTRHCCGYSWNFAYQYSFGPKRTVTDSAILGGDFDNSTFQAQAHWISLSLVVPR